MTLGLLIFFIFIFFIFYFLPDYLHLLPPLLQGLQQLRHRDPLEPRQAVLRVARQLEDGDPGQEAADVVEVVDDVVLVDDPTSGRWVKFEYRRMRDQNKNEDAKYGTSL